MISRLFFVFVFFSMTGQVLGETIKEDKKTLLNKSQETSSTQNSWESISISQPQKHEIPYEDVTHEIKIEQFDSPLKEYSYASFGKPDPFFPPLITNKIKKIEIPVTSILQKYALAQIQVAGIWTLENKEKRALLTAANAEGVIVSTGDPVGLEGGKISRIEDEAVIIQSYTLDAEGVRVFTENPLWLGGSHTETVKNDKIVKTIYSDESSLSRSEDSRDFLDNTKDQISREKTLSKEASSFISQGHTEKPATSSQNLAPVISQGRETSSIKQPSANDKMDPEDQKYQQKNIPMSAIPSSLPSLGQPAGEVQKK